MKRLTNAFILSALIAAGCASRGGTDDPNLVTLPHSGLRFAAKDANDRHLIVENGQECEQMADSLGSGAHPGRAVAASGAENAVVAGVTYGLGGTSAAAGAALGGIAGALAGGAVPFARGQLPSYETVVGNCMRGMGHKPLE